jgi:hypothetical protein
MKEYLGLRGEDVRGRKLLATVAEIVEIVSCARPNPTSRGLYEAVLLIAPENWRVFLSYITGWYVF